MTQKSIVPEIGKTYKCYDDGKIYNSRQYEVDVFDIIPWDKADDNLKETCKELSEKYKHLYPGTTDYFIFSISHETEVPVVEIFIRTTWGGWFGMGEINSIGRPSAADCGWCSGQLDVDNELTKNLEERNHEQ